MSVTAALHNGSKHVRFGDLTIREYPIELGEHPCCSEGAPIQIGWQPQTMSTRNLDLYEYMRGERRHGKMQLAIPIHKRAQLLLQAGYTLVEIGNATLEVDEIKRLRHETIKNHGWDRAFNIMKKTGKLPKGIMNGVASLLLTKPTQHTVPARSA